MPDSTKELTDLRAELADAQEQFERLDRAMQDDDVLRRPVVYWGRLMNQIDRLKEDIRNLEQGWEIADVR